MKLKTTHRKRYKSVTIFCHCKFHIGQYLRQHGWLPLPITMAVKSLKKVMISGASPVDPTNVVQLNPTRALQLSVHHSAKIEITQVFYYLENKSLKLKSQGLTNSIHGDERQRNVHTKRFPQVWKSIKTRFK